MNVAFWSSELWYNVAMILGKDNIERLPLTRELTQRISAKCTDEGVEELDFNSENRVKSN